MYGYDARDQSGLRGAEHMQGSYPGPGPSYQNQDYGQNQASIAGHRRSFDEQQQQHHRDNLSGSDEHGENNTVRAVKRQRMVWTPELHERFVKAVTQLGLANAVPKTIMQLMNVTDMTRENVASHLQKYRLQLKRQQGSGEEAPSKTPEQTSVDKPKGRLAEVPGSTTNSPPSKGDKDNAGSSAREAGGSTEGTDKDGSNDDGRVPESRGYSNARQPGQHSGTVPKSYPGTAAQLPAPPGHVEGT
ncbi:hypothetical protein WJX72_004176 [[Myrmecia] bisecta]|uniref:HTH myb-type domain-containing protein n=1 Tax=[Myrmecia] bisecta TaxID=41462 RepID=A0AAW1R6K9_9CHLO